MIWIVSLNAWILFIAIGASRWGEEPERFGARALILWLIGDHLYRLVAETPEFSRPDIGLFALDSFLAVSLIFIAISANRSWPFFAGSAALIPVIGHAVSFSRPEDMELAYWSMNQVPIVITLMAMSAGILANRARRTLGINAPPWTFG